MAVHQGTSKPIWMPSSAACTKPLGYQLANPKPRLDNVGSAAAAILLTVSTANDGSSKNVDSVTAYTNQCTSKMIYQLTTTYVEYKL